MKDKDRAFSPHATLCARGTACLFWLEYLDLPDFPRRQSLQDLSPRERRQVQKLQDHLLSCTTCPSLARSASSAYALQRSAFKSLLATSEIEVPSSVERILAAVRAEAQSVPSSPLAEREVPGTLLQRPFVPSSSLPRPRSLLRSTFALVAALLLVLTGLTIFHQFPFHPHPLSPAASAVVRPSLTATPGASHTLTPSWSSLVLTRPAADGKHLLVENYDPLKKRSVTLISSSLDTIIDGVSHSGGDLLSHRTTQDHTLYSLLSGPQFTVEGQGGNALWSTDDHVIYTFANQQIVQYDVSHHALQQLAFALPVPITHLQFYYQHYLYFSSSHDMFHHSLYRLNLTTGVVQFLVTSSSALPASLSFWLSPSGYLIYYVNSIQGTNSVYSLALDGSQRRLVASNVLPAGYTSDTTLVVLRKLQDRFQLVKLSSPEQVLVPDLAPGSLEIDASGLAVAPYGGLVVVAGHTADSSVQCWVTEVKTGSQVLFLDLQPSSARQQGLVQFVGWDRLPVPES